MSTVRSETSQLRVVRSAGGRISTGLAVALVMAGMAPTLFVCWLGGYLLSGATGPRGPDAAPSPVASDSPDDIVRGMMAVAAPAQKVPGLSPRELKDTSAEIVAAAGAALSVMDNADVQALVKTGAIGPDGPPTDDSSKVFGSWEIRFANDLTAVDYAKQLDFFEIELAVVMPGKQLTYATDLSGAKPKVRTGPSAGERRYYFTWNEEAMNEADRQVLGRAGIEAGDRVVLKLVPHSLEATLAKLAHERAGAKADRIRKTRFGVRPEKDGFALYVIDQWYK